MSISGRRWRAVVFGLAGMAGLAALTPRASAQDAAPSALIASVPAAVVRTPAEMMAFDAAHPALPIVMAPFLPTMDFGDYLASKAHANALRGAIAAKPSEPSPGPYGPPTVGAAGCNGIGQLAPVAGGLFPPDTHGAVGLSHFVQIVNQAVRVYTKALTGNCPTSILLNVTLNGFFGYFAAGLFDPRVVYDMTFDRWIVAAEGFPEGGSGSPQRQFIAVSQTGNAAGAYFIYNFNMNPIIGGGSAFWDFPQIGYDEEAIIFTGNVFNPGYVASRVYFWAKARMYRGLGFSFCIGFNLGAEGTIAPPIVLDESPVTVLATNRIVANRVRLTKFTGTSRLCPTVVETVDLTPTTALSFPPNAPQPGTMEVLDTLDGRFQNASTQFGLPPNGQTIRLWQTSTHGGGGFAIPRFFQINANVGASAIEDQCSYIASSTSDDFNPSVAANLAGTVFITYSSTDAPSGVNPQVRFTGKKLADACSTLTFGTAENTSTNPLTGNFDPNFGAQRWGDYSAVTIDPSLPTRAWAVNEKVQTGPSPTTWKSRFFNMDNP